MSGVRSLGNIALNARLVVACLVIGSFWWAFVVLARAALRVRSDVCDQCGVSAVLATVAL